MDQCVDRSKVRQGDAATVKHYIRRIRIGLLGSTFAGALVAVPGEGYYFDPDFAPGDPPPP